MSPAGAGPGAQSAHHWGSPAPDRQWPCTDAPAVIRRGDGRPGADTTLSWSRDGGRTGKEITVSGVPARVPKSVFPQHRTTVIGPAGYSSFTFRCHGPGRRAGSDSPKHWRVRAVPIRKTSRWAAPAAVAPYRAAGTGQGHRAGGPLYSALSRSRAGSSSDSPKHWRVRAVSVRKTSSWAAPATVQVAPCLAAATRQGHRASSPIYSLWSQSWESVHVQSRIGLTESLACAGPASQ